MITRFPLTLKPPFTSACSPPAAENPGKRPTWKRKESFAGAGRYNELFVNYFDWAVRSFS